MSLGVLVGSVVWRGEAVAVVGSLLAIEWMRSVHDRGSNVFVLLAGGSGGSGWVGLNIAIAMYNRWVVLRHSGV